MVPGISTVVVNAIVDTTVCIVVDDGVLVCIVDEVFNLYYTLRCVIVVFVANVANVVVIILNVSVVLFCCY